MTIDRKAFWTDVASGLVLAAVVPFLPRVLSFVVFSIFIGFVVLVVVDEAWGGSSLTQLAQIITDFIQSR